MSKVLIRRATLEDRGEILKIEQGASEAPHWSEASYRDILEDVGTPQRAIFVAEFGGLLAGFVVGAVVLKEGELESVVVRAEMRRTGVAKALCGELFRWAWGSGARLTRLEVRAANMRARALYKALGFEETGLRRGYYAEPVDDAVMMVKSLHPNDL